MPRCEGGKATKWIKRTLGYKQRSIMLPGGEPAIKYMRYERALLQSACIACGIPPGCAPSSQSGVSVEETSPRFITRPSNVLQQGIQHGLSTVSNIKYQLVVQTYNFFSDFVWFFNFFYYICNGFLILFNYFLTINFSNQCLKDYFQFW